ncbi:MAG: acetyl-CoA carboxylase biotin carboxyl carrier protein [Acidobacteria bacterium]|nr:acetyl-CoA carboxylase biotin carboxyl carrier protein [Acidobacteriota bacterium]
MDFDDITRILDLMREHELAEFELERDDFKLRLRKQGPAGDGGDEDVAFAIVKSPIVGTFYRAPEPGAAPYADVGQVVKKGQTLCVIEAMKLMNEITADTDGEVVKVYVENAQSVQYGERLFAIKPR